MSRVDLMAVVLVHQVNRVNDVMGLRLQYHLFRTRSFSYEIELELRAHALSW